MARRIARPVHLVAAAVLVVGLLVQVFLAGLGVFSEATAFITHRDFGYILTAVPAILIVTALVGGFGRSQAIVAAVMLVQFFLQSILVLQRGSLPAVAALHPVNGVIVLLLAAWLLRDAWARWPGSRVADSAEPVRESSAG